MISRPASYAELPLPHQVDGGSLAEIFVRRSATRWLCLYGYPAGVND